ncbi:MAG: NYN domain-containing protein [Candidatus Hermodarchaeota archaeon]
MSAAIMYLCKPVVVFPRKQKFFNALKMIGWILTGKPLKVKASGEKSQSGIDQVLFLDLYVLAESEAYEKAIIVGGDNIFVEAVRMLKKMNKEVEVWSFRNSLSKALLWEVGREGEHYLDDVLDDIINNDIKSIV